jgi:hypothetical protein
MAQIEASGTVASGSTVVSSGMAETDDTTVSGGASAPVPDAQAGPIGDDGDTPRTTEADHE